MKNNENTPAPVSSPAGAASVDVERVAREEAARRYGSPEWQSARMERAAFVEGAKFAALSARPVEAQEGLPCDGGCSVETGGPAEDCSRHGRPVREVWEALATVQARERATLARAEAAEARIRELEAR